MAGGGRVIVAIDVDSFYAQVRGMLVRLVVNPLAPLAAVNTPGIARRWRRCGTHTSAASPWV